MDMKYYVKNKYLVENLSKAPQGIHTMSGLVHLNPGQRKLCRLDEKNHAHATSLPFFCISDLIVDDTTDSIISENDERYVAVTAPPA